MIQDVVYNHTAEGNELGPTLSFKGIDNASYYRLAPDRRYYINDTGTGNTVNLCISACCRWSRTSSVLGSPRCGSTASASTWQPFWRESHTGSMKAVAFLMPAGRIQSSPGQADRRALGFRARRLSGRTLFAGMGRVERQF